MLWKIITLLANSPSPIVIVISESMAPAFHRGDLLFLSNQQERIRVGDIPVCWFPGEKMPMVHRAVNVFYETNAAGKEVYVLDARSKNANC